MGGRHSKYLPKRLAERYLEAQQDTELLSISAEVAVIDTRLGELFGRLDTTETSAAWVLANKLFHKMRADDPKERLAAEAELGDVLEQGLADVAAWSEIGSLIEQRRRCAETESKRLALREQFVTAKEALVLMAAIIRLVTDNVSDLDARRRISAGLIQLAGPADRRGSAALHAGDEAPADV